MRSQKDQSSVYARKTNRLQTEAEWAVITEDRGVEEVAAQQPVNPDAHLERLLNPELEVPWFKSAIRNVQEYFNPPKLPPLEITSTPVQVQDIWKTYDIAPNVRDWWRPALPLESTFWPSRFFS